MQFHLSRNFFAKLFLRNKDTSYSEVSLLFLLNIFNFYQAGVAGDSVCITAGDNDLVILFEVHFLFCDLLCGVEKNVC